MKRLIIIIEILLIPIGIFFIVSSTVPDVGAILVKPLCNGEFQKDVLSCITANGTTTYEDVLGGIGVICVVAASILLPMNFVFSLIATSMKLNRIITNGESAQATILKMQGTGTTVNEQPMFKFQLRVQPNYGQAYEAETKRIIPQSLLGSLTIGMNIPIKYDPDKPEDVAIDLDAFQSMAMEKAKLGQSNNDESLSEKLSELEEAYRSELISKEEYEKSRQRILGEL